KEIQRNCTAQLKDREMQMEMDVPPQLTLNSDRQLLMMVLQNLASNAIKFGRRGSVQVKVQGQGDAPQGFVCRFAVTDQGPGIAPEKVAELFRPFQQGETYGQTGSGLGLYIARHAAGLLGAKLSVDTALGKGATFYLDLPN